MAPPAKVWNEDLVNGLTARYQQDFQQRKTSQHMWRDAANAIREVRKDIKLTRYVRTYVRCRKYVLLLWLKVLVLFRCILCCRSVASRQ